VSGENPPAGSPPRYALAALFGRGGREMIEHIPHCVRLDMDVVHLDPCRAVVRLPYRDELVGDPARGVVFGGSITTLLDHAGGLAVFASLTELVAIATLDLRIDYLRAAKPGVTLLGEATCYRRTSHVAFVRASAYEASPDEPFATCLATFMLGANATLSPMAQAIRARPEES
jgi:uncharacterized protein (TIGR00369 family)